MGPNLEDFMRPGEKIPPLLPAAETLYQQRKANFMADQPSARCQPHGIPDQMLIRVPLKIVQNPGLTLILYEEFERFRQIFTDGRGFPPVANPAWLGYSIGHWDGEWFVVDTRGFNDQSWLDVEVTIDDSQAYAKPWSFPMQFEFLADTEMIEDVCDNEGDSVHSIGK